MKKLFFLFFSIALLKADFISDVKVDAIKVGNFIVDHKNAFIDAGAVAGSVLLLVGACFGLSRLFGDVNFCREVIKDIGKSLPESNFDYDDHGKLIRPKIDVRDRAELLSFKNLVSQFDTSQEDFDETSLFEFQRVMAVLNRNPFIRESVAFQFVSTYVGDGSPDAPNPKLSSFFNALSDTAVVNRFSGVRTVLRNFLVNQLTLGNIDAKPGSGERAGQVFLQMRARELITKLFQNYGLDVEEPMEKHTFWGKMKDADIGQFVDEIISQLLKPENGTILKEMTNDENARYLDFFQSLLQELFSVQIDADPNFAKANSLTKIVNDLEFIVMNKTEFVKYFRRQDLNGIEILNRLKRGIKYGDLEFFGQALSAENVRLYKDTTTDTYYLFNIDSESDTAQFENGAQISETEFESYKSELNAMSLGGNVMEFSGQVILEIGEFGNGKPENLTKIPTTLTSLEDIQSILNGETGTEPPVPGSGETGIGGSGTDNDNGDDNGDLGL